MNKKDGKLLHNIFKNKAFAVVQKYLAATVFFSIPLLHGSDDSVDQSTDGVCSTPTEEYCETSTVQYGSVRITPTFGGANATRAATLQTEPTEPLVYCSLEYGAALFAYASFPPAGAGRFGVALVE